MCGRYGRKSAKQRVAEVFQVNAGLDDLPYEEADDLRPQSLQPIIYTNDHGERQIEMMRWAFKLPDRLLFNARSEGIEHSRFWADAFRNGRAIVPGDVIYEWQKTGEKQNAKWAFTIPGQKPFGMAAVWKPWQNPKTGQWEKTFAILTGEPNELMAPIHDRMTTFLDRRDYAEYLAPAERPPVHVLRIWPAEMMRAQRSLETSLARTQIGLFES